VAKNRFLFDGLRDGRWVRAWREGRGRNGEIIVQIWNSGTANGEPNGDWAMPAVLGLESAIEQAELQTPK
jgi:hypothetical protein